jgi:MFS family permease
MPKFQKNFPKNALDYFDPASDEEFKARHPIGYWVLVFFGILAIILPMIVFLLVTELFFPVPSSGFLMLAYAGCFIIGIGLFNIVAAFIGQYLGHWVTFGAFLLGALMIAVSCVILYVPGIYAIFNEDIVSFYFISLLFYAVPPIYYLMFRMSVNSWLRAKRVSKTRIEKLKKGKRNYWWYQAIHDEMDMGLLYFLNKLFTIAYPVSLGILLLFGWLKYAALVIGAAYALISLIAGAMSLFSSIQTNKETFGQAIVLLRFDKNNRLCSILLDLAVAGIPMYITYALWKGILQMF